MCLVQTTDLFHPFSFLDEKELKKSRLICLIQNYSTITYNNLRFQANPRENPLLNHHMFLSHVFILPSPHWNKFRATILIPYVFTGIWYCHAIVNAITTSIIGWDQAIDAGDTMPILSWIEGTAMEEILQNLTCVKPCASWATLHIECCRISEPSRLVTSTIYMYILSSISSCVTHISPPLEITTSQTFRSELVSLE